MTFRRERRSAASLLRLVLRARAGDELAFTQLARNFEPLLHFYSGRLYAPGLDHDDLMQEARIGLWHAVTGYRPRGGVTLTAFVVLCVERQLFTAIRRAKREKHGPLNDALALDAPVRDELDVPLQNLLPSPAPSPHEQAEMRDRIAVLVAAINGLSSMERNLLVAHAAGEPYAQAAARRGVSAKSVDNAVQRARRKLECVRSEVAA